MTNAARTIVASLFIGPLARINPGPRLARWRIEGSVAFCDCPQLAYTNKSNQGAGILFNLKQDGDYLTVRANPPENNLVLWKFEKGRRSSLKWIRDVLTAAKTWHELKVVVKGSTVEAFLNGKHYLKHQLAERVSGKIGVWSKADSHV